MSEVANYCIKNRLVCVRYVRRGNRRRTVQTHHTDTLKLFNYARLNKPTSLETSLWGKRNETWKVTPVLGQFVLCFGTLFPVPVLCLVALNVNGRIWYDGVSLYSKSTVWCRFLCNKIVCEASFYEDKAISHFRDIFSGRVYLFVMISVAFCCSGKFCRALSNM